MECTRPANKGGFIFESVMTVAIFAIVIVAFVNGNFDESGRVGPFVITQPLALAGAVSVTVHSWFKAKKRGSLDGP